MSAASAVKSVVKVVVDTNIIFSSLLNSNGTIGDLLFNSEPVIEFYSCHYMQFEIDKHWTKLLKISKLSEVQLRESQIKIYSKISFINEELIPQKTWVKAEEIVREVDIDDTDFIALSKHLKAFLWTGDKELYNGLKQRRFKNVYNTSDLLALRLKLTKF